MVKSMSDAGRLIIRSLSLACPILLFLAFAGIKSYAQDRCGTVEYTRVLFEKNLIRDDERKFEKWLSQRKENIGSRINATATFKIPVVVHVIHKGEAVGSGSNISDAQIASQIKVLNKDFRRLNADTTQTPAEFLSVAGKINFEFVLAKQSPDGVVTNGIIRVKGTKNQWTLDDNNALKASSYWPAEDYLNIWVTDIASTILGYAQFPVSDLPGLEDAETNRLTDGVVLDYRIVGSNQDGSFNLTTDFYRGRTATHEIGHFFGLRHIWGDDEGACNGAGDYVDDTPNQGNSSDGCPSHPQIGCSVKAMFQNYMDYTNDVCMNLYTRQQVERMLTVLENSPRRTSLLTSPGLYDPSLVNNDLGIKDILSPSNSECMGTVAPALTLQNKGLNTITSAKIQLTVNSAIIETKTFDLGELDPQGIAQVAFTALTISPGNAEFNFEILATNNGTDGKPLDNTKVVTTAVPHEIATPFWENFNVLPQDWALINDDEKTTWAIAQTADGNSAINKALYIKFFQSEEDEDEIDVITTPVIDLSRATSPFLAFDIAYGRYQNRSDGLEVYALLDCSADLTDNEVIYSKYGGILATVSSTSGSFSPDNENQWRREVIDLSKFIGQERIQFAFVAVNDQGNNLYLDNIALRPDVSENIAIKQLTAPSPVQCNTDVQPVLIIENKGDQPINSFRVEYFANNDALQTMSAPADFSLLPGGQTSITLPVMTLRKGSNKISFAIVQPNGFKDIDDSDNELLVETIVDDTSDKIPLRKNFDEAEGESSWQIVSPMGNRVWQTISTNYDQSLYFEGDTDGSEQEYSWFVSPVLDFSDAVTSSLFFDLSYQHKGIDSIKDQDEDIFKVLASRDCGQTFDEVLFSGNENLLSELNTNNNSVPGSPGDWGRNFLNLNSLAGEQSIRIAFVVSKVTSGSLYLDNIEFFLSDNPSPFSTMEVYTLYPNKIEDAKSFYVTFNLENRQTVKYEMVDMSGRQVSTKELTDVLNQTYQIDIEDASSGIYLVRLLIDKKYYVSRIVVIP
jgi:hypothetical protein